MQSRAERGLTLMHATPVAASQVEDEASPLLMCASASFSLFQTEELVPRLGFVTRPLQQNWISLHCIVTRSNHHDPRSICRSTQCMPLQPRSSIENRSELPKPALPYLSMYHRPSSPMLIERLPTIF
ncbi:Dynein heavy chain, cytoplasmic [Fusarium oxysporum f. sp. albedinis]|nr:Dynein heavy chain, cytoplasmic [Fusarium oxysporum f. sp. albedinis]